MDSSATSPSAVPLPHPYEIEALEKHFIAAANKLMKMYRVTALKARLLTSYDAQRFRYPAGAAAQGLSQEISLFDQACDCIEIKLARAILVTQKAIEREEDRLKAETQAYKSLGKAEAAEASYLPLFQTESTEDAVMTDSQPATTSSPVPRLVASSSDSRLRRQSTIALSSLKGTRRDTPFQLKLDLSSVPMPLDDNIIPGLFSPGTLAPATGLPPPSAIEPGQAFGEELSTEPNGSSSSLSVVGAVQINLNHEDHDLTLSHGGRSLSDETSTAIEMHLDESIDNLFGDIGVSPGESGLQSQLELPTKSPEGSIRTNKDMFRVTVQDLENVTPNSALQSRENIENAEFRGDSLGVERIIPNEGSLEPKNLGGDAGDLTLGADFGHADFVSLSPGLFDSLDSQAASQYAEGIDFNELASMTGLLRDFDANLSSSTLPK